MDVAATGVWLLHKPPDKMVGVTLTGIEPLAAEGLCVVTQETM